MHPTLSRTGHHAANEVASWVPPLARAGYAAKGIVYALVGGIAFQAASASSQPEGATGALASLVDEPGGRWILGLVAFGLAAHVVWRLVQALLDPEHPEGGTRRIGMRLFYLLSAAIYGSLAFTAWRLTRLGAAGGEAGGSEGQQEIWIARLLEAPAGAWMVMLAGAGVIAYGVHQLLKAFRGDINRRVAPPGGQVSRGVQWIGRIGTAARGVVLMPIGWFAFQAGREYRAAASADTREVLGMLDHQGLLAAVGLGLLAYGVHQLAKALYRRIERPR